MTNSRRFAVVDTGSQIDMALAAELAGIDTNELYQLNPGVNRWATDPDGPHRLLVPAEQADAFQAALASLGDGERVRWTKHEVKKGETIGALADKYQTTVAVLREVNGLRGNTLHAGQSLLIPRREGERERLRIERRRARRARAVGVARNGQRREHEVQPGETLWSISRDYGVDLRTLASWNSMAPGDVLSVGRELVVWTKEPRRPRRSYAAPVQAATPRALDVAEHAAPAGRPASDVTSPQFGKSRTSCAAATRCTRSRAGSAYRCTELREWNGVAAEKVLQAGPTAQDARRRDRAKRLMAPERV